MPAGKSWRKDITLMQAVQQFSDEDTHSVLVRGTTLHLCGYPLSRVDGALLN